MTEEIENLQKFVEQRYDDAINYYWKASRYNKMAYKLTRILTVILGALVTLVASMASATFIVESVFWDHVFKLGTPLLAASLSIIAGFSQAFQWGAAWQDMVLTAQRLQKERDRFLITPPEDLDLVKEVELLNNFVIEESKGFFERMLGSARYDKGELLKTRSESEKPVLKTVSGIENPKHKG